MTLSIVIHGGCDGFDFNNPMDVVNYKEKQAQTPRIINAAWDLLVAGKSALDVAEFAINELERTPCYSAGIGAALDWQGQVCLDASIMRGDTLEAGAVAKLKQIPNAVSVARKVMETTGQVFLVDEGANTFADLCDFKRLPNAALVTELQTWRLKNMATPFFKELPNKGTVGAVVRDAKGLIAAGTSTGGLRGNRYGRVGDTPIIGAGCYADNALGGASTTGYGEQILRKVMCKSALDRMKYLKLDVQTAAQEAIRDLATLDYGNAWIIMIDPQGNIGWHGNDDFCPRACMSSTMQEPLIAIDA